MTFPSIIAIDGPAASGKSTLGKILADNLGYLYFDTGVMYRAITWVALQNQIDPSDENGLNKLALNCVIDIQPPSLDDGRDIDVTVDGEDITWEIRKPEVDANVSQVSTFAGVRQALTEQQRRIGLRGRVVMVGRDIGTVVLPEADLKIYLDATTEERARRRYREILERGQESNFNDILEAMRVRDQIDSTREIAPLRPADDAVILNSDEMDIEGVLQYVLQIIGILS